MAIGLEVSFLLKRHCCHHMKMKMSSIISPEMQESLLNVKSRAVYDRWWSLYNGFCEDRKLDFLEFSSFMDFVGFLSKSYAYSSLWQVCDL